VTGIARRKTRFVVVGRADTNGAGRMVSVGFFFVDELERLVLLIMERSPNLKLND
jgi:hypothetical protein